MVVLVIDSSPGPINDRSFLFEKDEGDENDIRRGIGYLLSVR
jgi:hypothetical protein